MLGVGTLDVGLEAGIAGEPGHDIRVGDLLERPDLAAAVEPMGPVERLDDHPAHPWPLLELDGDDLADADALAIVAPSEEDLELRSDREACVVHPLEAAVHEDDGHDRREVQVVLDDDFLDRPEHALRRVVAAELEGGGVEERRADRHVRRGP